MDNVKMLLEKFDGRMEDLCYKLLMENSENMQAVFEYACENYFSPPDEAKIEVAKVFTDDDVFMCNTLYKDIIWALIDSVTKQCHYAGKSKTDFYSELWDAFCKHFDTDKALAFAFATTLYNIKIPYNYISMPIKMETETYHALCRENVNLLRLMKYVYACEYIQKNETTSLLLTCLDKAKTRDAKIVLLSNLLDFHASARGEFSEVSRILDDKIDFGFHDKLKEFFDFINKEQQE